MNSTARRATNDFFAHAGEIRSSCPEEKVADAINAAAERLLENIFEDFPEVRALRKRERDLERKHSVDKGFIYCPTCITWSPKPPPEVKAIDRQWMGIRAEKKAEFIQKALEGYEPLRKGEEHVRRGTGN